MPWPFCRLSQDGGFEAGDFCYWTLTGDTNVYDDNFVDYADDPPPYGTGYSPFAGNYFGALGQPFDLGYLSQPLATRAGQLYLLSFWLENPSGDTPNQFQVQWNTNSASANVIFNQSNLGAFGWSNLLFVVQAPTNITTLRFGFRNDNDYFGLDSVSVLPVPGPALRAPVVARGSIQLAWTALPGAQYQVQSKTNLTQTTWSNLSSVITATMNPMTFSNNIGTVPWRYYRIMLLP